MIFVNLVIILSQWFKANEFLKLMGFVSLIASLGSLTSTIPLSAWITFSGWRSPFLTIGIILVLSSYLLYTVLVSKPRKIFQNHTQSKKSGIKSPWIILHKTISNRQAWATFLCHFGVVGAYVGFIGSWGVPYGVHALDLSRTEASQLMMYGLLGAIVGGPLISWITSRVDSIKKVYTFVHLITLISWIGLFLTGVDPSFMLVVALLFIIGFGNGASALTFVVVRKSFPIEEVGVVSGFSNMGGFLSAVLLPIVFGKVLDLFPPNSVNVGYHYGFIIPALFSLVGLFGAMMVKIENKEDKQVLSA